MSALAGASVLIVGGGLAGLATAFYLGRAGVRSTIVEKAGRLGGLIRTDSVCGCDLEAGPDSYLSSKTAVAELAEELGDGLTEKIISSNDSARRIFVVRQGRLVPMPKGMSMMVPAEWGPVLQSPLLGVGTKIRLMRETLTQPQTRAGDFSVGELVSSHFGREVLEYVTEPLLSGVYGGDSSSLSARSVLPRFVTFEEETGSLIRGVRKSVQRQPPAGSLFRSFEGGMQTLIDSLQRAIAGRTRVIYQSVRRVDKGASGWRLSLGTDSISSQQVVMACPAWTAAELLSSGTPQMAAELKNIPYSSAILVNLLFKAEELGRPLSGFGFLAPKQERQTIAAGTFVHIKFPSRIAAGLAALRGFIIGEKAEAMSSLGDDEIAKAVQSDLERLIDFKAQPVFQSVQRWPRSMPQYVVGHAARVSRILEHLQQETGLFLVGNYLDGVGVPDTIRQAKEAAKRIEAVCV